MLHDQPSVSVTVLGSRSTRPPRVGPERSKKRILVGMLVYGANTPFGQADDRVQVELLEQSS